MNNNSLTLTEWQLQQYLKKMHLQNKAYGANLETLKILQESHLKYVPYENFDTLNNKITSLQHQEMFEKIIMKNRGGICFELNGLYNWLLFSLGYKVTSYAVRFIDKFEEYQMRRHRVICVEVEGKRYITDVGVNSESPRIPLELREEVIQSDGISEYKYTRDPFWGWVLWQKERGKAWKRLFGFTEEPQLDIDFIALSAYIELHPNSMLNKTKAISIFREDCNITIRGNYLKFYLDGKVKYRYLIPNGEELQAILWEYFGIALDYVPSNFGMD